MKTHQPPDGRWTIILDGDDTLWECSMYYRAAAAVCRGLIGLKWMNGPGYQEIAELNLWIQRAMLNRWGYERSIYEDAWQETYIQLCHRHNHPIDHQEVLPALRIGAGIIAAAPYLLFPGVVETLACLRKRGHALHLLTLGPNERQWNKIRRNKLEQYFTGIHVVQHGKGVVMRLLAEDPGRTMMVGDSLPRDMYPARGLGLRPVWVHTIERWSRPKQNPDLYGIRTIHHVIELCTLLELGEV